MSLLQGFLMLVSLQTGRHEVAAWQQEPGLGAFPQHLFALPYPNTTCAESSPTAGVAGSAVSSAGFLSLLPPHEGLVSMVGDTE